MPYSRNHVNIMTCHAVIVLPGDHGTRHETELALMMKKPHILFGPEKAFAKFPGESVRVQTIEQVQDFLDEFLKFFDGRSIFERIP
jgi:predicted Rossmann-fold nucleotide-binding protein